MRFDKFLKRLNIGMLIALIIVLLYLYISFFQGIK